MYCLPDFANPRERGVEGRDFSLLLSLRPTQREPLELDQNEGTPGGAHPPRRWLAVVLPGVGLRFIPSTFPSPLTLINRLTLGGQFRPTWLSLHWDLSLIGFQSPDIPCSQISFSLCPWGLVSGAQRSRDCSGALVSVISCHCLSSFANTYGNFTTSQSRLCCVRFWDLFCGGARSQTENDSEAGTGTSYDPYQQEYCFSARCPQHSWAACDGQLTSHEHVYFSTQWNVYLIFWLDCWQRMHSNKCRF